MGKGEGKMGIWEKVKMLKGERDTQKIEKGKK